MQLLQGQLARCLSNGDSCQWLASAGQGKVQNAVAASAPGILRAIRGHSKAIEAERGPIYLCSSCADDNCLQLGACQPLQNQ